MKQKNLILVIVAVGCGLVAAFLTANMSARPKQSAAEQIEIPCVAMDLPVGTKLNKDELAKFVTTKKVNKDAAPPMYVPTIEELADKRITRTLRQAEHFDPKDLTTNGFLDPPAGHSVMTVRCSIDEAVAGFVGPGAKVDVIASLQGKKSQVWYIFPLFQEILVLAVDSNSNPSPNGGAFANLSMVSFAVNAEQSLMLQGAVSCGSQMRLALRHQEKPATYEKILTREEIWDIFSGRIEERKKEEPKPEPKQILVKVKVPTTDLPTGTELSESVIATKFKDAEFPETFVPENAIADLKPYAGKYLVKDLSANFFVPRSAIGEKPAEKPSTGPDDHAPSPNAPPNEPKARKTYIDVTVQSANGVKKFRYWKKDNGEFVPVGEVPALPPGDDEQQPEPKMPASSDEPKPSKLKQPRQPKDTPVDDPTGPRITLAN